MGYNVQVADGGYLGWKLLERTLDSQKQVFSKSAEIQRSRDYFVENISKVEAAEDLVGNYKLLSVALRAFGLDDDINNKYFIRKVLEADPDDKSSLINKLPDKRYEQLNAAFKLWNTPAPEGTTTTVDSKAITDMYVTRSFERNIGERHQEIEISLNAQRELKTLAEVDLSQKAKWYQIVGSKPLRKVFEGAFGLSSHFANLPIDRQVAELKSRTERLMGSSDIDQFSDSAKLDHLLKYYLIRNQAAQSASMSRYSSALAILSNRG